MPEDELDQRALSRIGTTLKSKYRLDALIGIGGMGAVYRATHRNRAQLAVKILHPELSSNAAIRGRFLREGYAANSVQHPGVVLVVDDDVAEDGAAFLVMELLDGETVEHLSDSFGGKMPASVAVAIVQQLLDVLAAAHGAGIVHRDIKPANLFLTRDGTVKVLDFGIARVLEAKDAGALATGAGIPIGTPAFMAPEQALARSAEIDARTDVWAAGATLFTLLVGETVHASPSSVEALVNAATRAARSLATAAPDTPKPLVDVVDTALAFEKDARWPGARAMGVALVEAFVAVSGAPPSKAALAGLLPPRASSLPPSLEASSGPAAEEFSVGPTLAAPRVPSRDGSPGELRTTSGASSAAPRARIGRGRLSLAVAGVATLAVVVAAFAMQRVGRQNHNAPVPIAPWTHTSKEEPLVLIGRFDNRTQEAVLDETIELLLGTALKRSRTLYPVWGTTLRALVLEEVPDAAGNDALVVRLLADKDHRPVALIRGFVAPEGTGFSISLTAEDGVSGAKFAETTVHAPSIERVAWVVATDLACTLRIALHDDACDDASRGTTGLSESMEANHEYVAGRAPSHNANNREAEPHFARAVELDPGFATAQLSLGLLLWNTGNASLGLSHVDSAIARADQLSDRDKVQLAAITHVMNDEFDEAVSAYEDRLARWPRDQTSRGNLTEALLRGGRIDEALETARGYVPGHPHNVVLRGLLAELEDISGHPEEAARESHAIVASFPKPPSLTHTAGVVAERLLGHTDSALELEALLARADATAGAVLEADGAMFEGRLEDARAILEKSIAADDAKRSTSGAHASLASLAEVLERSGERELARVAAKRAAMSEDLTTLVRAGRVLARVGETAEADAVENKVLAHTGQRAPLFGRIIRAEAFLARHAPKDAIAALGDLGKGAGSPLAHVILGEAELDMGALDDALSELEAALARPGALAFAFFDETPTLHYLPPLAYSVARTKELLHRDDAGDAYRVFLAMEPNARADPLVERAKRRVVTP